MEEDDTNGAENPCGRGNPGATHWAGCACHEAQWAARLAEAEKENAEVHLRFARLLDRLTDGRMSKTNYSVETMEQEIDETYERWHEKDRKDVEQIHASQLAEAEARAERLRDVIAREAANLARSAQTFAVTAGGGRRWTYDPSNICTATSARLRSALLSPPPGGQTGGN